MAFLLALVFLAPLTHAQPAPLRIDSVVLAPVQPHADSAVIWYDDFDQDRIASYMEPRAGSPDARRSAAEALGGAGQSMECHYTTGSQGIGNRKLVFGDSPIGHPLRATETFHDIYWRIYVKHQLGWTGAPAKMSRATGIVSDKWNQAFILHVWSSGLPLTLDPASGVLNGQVVTTQYNDFDNLHWLGNKPKGKFPIHSTAESGRWVCVEARVKLNTPGQKDGYGGLWVDGRLDTERVGMDFCGTYTGLGSAVNAVFLEAYWNSGSPVNQYRWYDDFVVSTKPIGPLTAAANPILIRMADPACAAWEVQLAADPDGTQPVWASGTLPSADLRVTVNNQTGQFSGPASERSSLASGPVYFCQARQRDGAGQWSAWSAWHQPFKVASEPSGTSLAWLKSR